MRTVKGEPFVILCGPIYDCLCTIINDEQSTDDDYECILLQVRVTSLWLWVFIITAKSCLPLNMNVYSIVTNKWFI